MGTRTKNAAKIKAGFGGGSGRTFGIPMAAPIFDAKRRDEQEAESKAAAGPILHAAGIENAGVGHLAQAGLAGWMLVSPLQRHVDLTKREIALGT